MPLSKVQSCMYKDPLFLPMNWEKLTCLFNSDHCRSKEVQAPPLITFREFDFPCCSEINLPEDKQCGTQGHFAAREVAPEILAFKKLGRIYL